MVRLRFLALLSLGFALAGWSAEPVAGGDTPPGLHAVRQLAAGQPVRIVCFGDSITGLYYHTGNRRAWCDWVGVALNQIYPDARVEMINAGISGHTTVRGLERMERDVLSKHPQLILVMFGMNDVARVPAETYRANLREIVARGRAAGAELVLMTPNYVSAGDALRPVVKVADYAQIAREVGRELNVPVTDTYRAFQSVQLTDQRAWLRIMSDTIHPNARGHRLLAQEVVWTMTGRRVVLPDLPTLPPGLSHVAARLRARQPVRIVAMKPYDQLIAPALRRAFPDARIEVIAWDAAGRSVAEIEQQAKTFGWPHYGEFPQEPKPDLSVVAIPAGALAANDAQFFHSYQWVVNYAMSYDPKGGDCLVVLPSVAQPELDAAERTAENLALEVVGGQDVPGLHRLPGDATPTAELFERWISEQLRE